MPDRDDDQQARHAAVRRLLLEPASYPDKPRTVDLIETHISCVFVTDRLVYKLKKPVHFEFVDFHAAAARERACREEVRLNRRLAPGVYLGVLPITQAVDGALALDGPGTPVDWVVQMRRLPTERTLEESIKKGSISPEDIAGVSRVLGDFYAQAAPVPTVAADYRRQIEHHVRANRADLLAAAPTEDLPDVRRAHAAQLQFLLLEPETFDARVKSGRIIDGHGDLRPEHICLTEPPVIFDCLEFDAELRRLDIADELSFLAMECQRLGAAWIGAQVRAACLERCHDQPPAALLAFYQSYRACVRAKVAVLRSQQLAASDRAVAWVEAAQYLQLAATYARDFAAPVLLVVSGLMGSGKSTLAAALAERLGCEILQTDALRRELLPDASETTGYNAGPYAPANRERVYEELLSRAADVLNSEQSVVLDGTFLSAGLLRRAAAVAAGARAGLLVIRCQCPDEVSRRRIAGRLAAGPSLSAARPELYELQRQELEDVPTEVPGIVVDTTLDLAAQVEAVRRSMATATAHRQQT